MNKSPLPASHALQCVKTILCLQHVKRSRMNGTCKYFDLFSVECNDMKHDLCITKLYLSDYTYHNKYSCITYIFVIKPENANVLLDKFFISSNKNSRETFISSILCL